MLVALATAGCVSTQDELVALDRQAATYCLAHDELWTDAATFQRCKAAYQIPILERRIAIDNAASRMGAAIGASTASAPSMNTCDTRRLMDGTLQTHCY